MLAAVELPPSLSRYPTLDVYRFRHTISNHHQSALNMLFHGPIPSCAALTASLLICLTGMSQAAAPNVMDSAMGGLSAPCAGNALKSLQSNPKLSNCLNLLGLVQLATLSQDESVLPPLQVPTPYHDPPASPLADSA